MQVYIASSWKNEHAVRMLTENLRTYGYVVHSFLENNGDEGYDGEKPQLDFDHWVLTREAGKCFEYDTRSASKSDAVIYLGPGGTDAWCEVGIAWANRVPVIGLWAKGEAAGLMRKCVCWVKDHHELLQVLQQLQGDKYAGN